jgi:molybdenum ABC transporter molybdate-binding protein
MRYPMDEIAKAYEKEYGVAVQLQYGGSNTLLNQLEVSHTGDLYLAGDDSYTRMAQDKGLAAERLPVAMMRPVIAVRKDNDQISNIDDLLKPGRKVAIGNPDAAAIGKKTRKLLQASGQWDKLETRVMEYGVFSPTVNEIANAVKIGSVEAGITWDSTVMQYDELKIVGVPELDAGKANIEIVVLNSTKQPTAALRFARYVTAKDKGLEVFDRMGWEITEGDVWADVPEITFFAGSVNRRALEPIVNRFSEREGVEVNTVYNGCGILTAQMRTIRDSGQSGFPDTYMACDRYYLETVKEHFETGIDVSDTDIVIVVQEGNPKNIQQLDDLARPGIRVAIGQPDQCTIGVLTRRLLQDAELYDKLFEIGNIVTQTQTSAMLVPSVTTNSADATLAYLTDTLAAADKIDVVPIDSELAKAIQPFSVARSSDHKHLGHRLFDAIARSQPDFESAGFHWRLGEKEKKAVSETKQIDN